MKDLLSGFDILDLALIVAFFYLLVASTLGYVVPEMAEPANEWTKYILFFLIGKKTPNVLQLKK